MFHDYVSLRPNSIEAKNKLQFMNDDFLFARPHWKTGGADEVKDYCMAAGRHEIHDLANPPGDLVAVVSAISFHGFVK